MSTKRLNRNERNPDTINETIRKLQEKDEALGNLPLSVASGGTGQATAAEALGELTQALTEDTSPDRVADFVPAYDASADTGKKVTLGRVAGVAVLASGSVSDGAALDLALDATGFSTFKIFKLHVYNLVPATDAAVPFLRISDDGGATFEADAADYSWAFTGSADTVGGAAYDDADDSDSEIELSNDVGNVSASEGCAFEITILNPASTTQTTRFHWIGHKVNGSGAMDSVAGSGRCLVAAASTDVRIIMSSGNLTCNYTLIGIL